MAEETRKAALVTGAGRRVGRAIAVELGRAGCDVAVHYHESQSGAAEVVREIDDMGSRAMMLRGDLAEMPSWERVIEQAVAGLGRLDILVNNAAIFPEMRLEKFDAASWDRTFTLNVTAAVGLCHFAAGHLARSGSGRIVNILDIAVDRPWSSHLAYCASKAALANLTVSLAKALAPAVCVNGVSPGIAEFPEHYDEETRATLVSKVPLKRAGTADEIARVVRFLCCEAEYLTGQIIRVDGGRSVAG